MFGDSLKNKKKILLIGGKGTLGYAILKSKLFKNIKSPSKKNFKYNDAAIDIYSSMIEVNELVNYIYTLNNKKIHGVINVEKKKDSDYNHLKKFIKKIKKTIREAIQKKQMFL